MRLTYRTARVLQGVQEHPGASNREIADSAGISDPGQVSKLLRRLERLGLLENHGLGHAQGEPNEWKLTPLGGQVAQRLSVLTRDRTGGCMTRLGRNHPNFLRPYGALSHTQPRGLCPLRLPFRRRHNDVPSTT